MCIRDEYRCRGLARKMLLYLLDRARTAGMYEAFLEVRPSNMAAARLYHSLGFEQVGIRRGYYQASGGPRGRRGAAPRPQSPSEISPISPGRRVRAPA